MGWTAIVLGSGVPDDILGKAVDDRQVFYEDAASSTVYVRRHSAGDASYAMPSRIDWRYIWRVLTEKYLVTKAIGICSVGTLKPEKFAVGDVVVPEDFFGFHDVVHYHDDAKAHVMPGFSKELRYKLLEALPKSAKPTGVYVQSSGPRFETKAEIKVMSTWGDLIGMTGASEATMACELGVEYACVCVVDNVGHGLDDDDELTLSKFKQAQTDNHSKTMACLEACKVALQAHKLKKTNSSAVHRISVDTILKAGWVVTCDEFDKILKNAAVVVSDGTVLNVVSAESADELYAAAEEIDLGSQSAIVPGFVNAHTHAPMVYMRGFGDDTPLVEWLITKIWPAEGKTLSPELVADGTELACAEMIRCGTTCFNDMYFFPTESRRILEKIGMRAFVGNVVLDFPSPMASGPEEYLELAEKNLSDAAAAAENDDLVRFTVAPHAPYSVSENHLVECAKLAKKFNVVLHTHLHESTEEVSNSACGNREHMFCHRSDSKCRPLENFSKLNILSDNCVLAHMTQLTDEEIDFVASAKASVAHCPSSNMKLVSGSCRVFDLLEAGVNVCIGTDGAASNNSLDMVAETKLAALFAKSVSKNASAVPAKVALKMATINGAKALHADSEFGSIEVGKSADLACFDLSDVETMPIYDVVSTLVYSTDRSKVSDVMCKGRMLMRSRKLQTIDETHLRAKARKWADIIAKVDEELNEK